VIRTILTFRSKEGTYNTLTRTRSALEPDFSKYLDWVTQEIPAGALLVSLKFESSPLMPEDIVLQRAG
jgi:hypothetical protein